MRKGTNLANRLFEHLWEEFICAPAYPDFELQDIPSGSSTIVVRWRCKEILFMNGFHIRSGERGI